jgi:peptide/nickel transport system substrate-binding protein
LVFVKNYLLLFIIALFLTGWIFSACSREADQPPDDQQENVPTQTADQQGHAPETGTQTPASPGEAQEEAPGEAEEPSQVRETASPDRPLQDAPLSGFLTPEVKRAIAAAIDREAIVDIIFEGRADAAYHTVPFDYPLSGDPFFQRYGIRDLSLSIEILLEEGFTEENPLIIDLWAPHVQPFINEENVLLLIKEQLEDTELIVVNLHTLDHDEYLQSIEVGEPPLFIHHWQPDYADPDNWVSPFASCNLSDYLGIHYCRSIMDEMLHLAAAAEGADRLRLYEEIGDMFTSDPPVIPIFWEYVPVVYREGIQGFEFAGTRELNFWSIEFIGEAAPEDRESLTIGTTLSLDNPDPFSLTNIFERDIIHNTSQPLMRFLPGTFELTPGAAENFPTANPERTEYTFILREDLRYSDGTPVTSQDYVRSWEYLSGLETRRADIYLRYVENVSTPDDRTIVYHLTGSNSFFPALAATTLFIPLHPNYDGFDWYSLDNFGAGPYRVSSHSPGEQTILEANPEYTGDEIPAVQTIIIRYYENSLALLTSVETGEVDLAWRGLEPRETLDLIDDETLRVDMVDTHVLRFIAFNHLYSPQKDQAAEIDDD